MAYEKGCLLPRFVLKASILYARYGSRRDLSSDKIADPALARYNVHLSNGGFFTPSILLYSLSH